MEFFKKIQYTNIADGVIIIDITMIIKCSLHRNQRGDYSYITFVISRKIIFIFRPSIAKKSNRTKMILLFDPIQKYLNSVNEISNPPWQV